jgi:hypothetical protein
LPAAATYALLGRAIGVALAAGEEIGDGAEDGLRFGVGVAGTTIGDVEATLGVALGPDGTAAHAAVNRANKVSHRCMSPTIPSNCADCVRSVRKNAYG